MFELLLSMPRLNGTSVNSLLLSLCSLLIFGVIWQAKSRYKKEDNLLRDEKIECEREKEAWIKNFNNQIEDFKQQRKEDKQEAGEQLDRVTNIFQNQLESVRKAAQENHNAQERKIIELTKQIEKLKYELKAQREENEQLSKGCGHGSCFYTKKK